MKYKLVAIQDGGLRQYPIIELTFNGELPSPFEPSQIVLDSKIHPCISSHVSRWSGYEWMMSKMNKGDVGLEIGVDYGDGIARWLETEPSRIVGVDPWIRSGHETWYSQSQDEMDKRYGLVVDRFFKNINVAIYRGTSDDYFGELIPTFKFDWIYIDGDHRHEAVYHDLCNCLNHVKSGSWIFGDDILCDVWGKEVGPALDRFLAEYGHRVECIWRKSNPFALLVK